MARKKRFLAVCILMVTVLAMGIGPGGLARADSSLPVMVAGAVKTPPVLDGRLDDACWKTAEPAGPFLILPHAGKLAGTWEEAEAKFRANVATTLVCYDDKNLYVAYRCPAPQDAPARSRQTQRDGDMWGSDDVVELFLAPPGQGGFFQVLVNSLGTVADGRSGAGGYDPNWNAPAIRAAAQPLGTGYTAEIVVPFGAIGEKRPADGTAWSVNFTRTGNSAGGLSTWSNVGSNFFATERYGWVVFGSRQAYFSRELSRLQNEFQELAADPASDLAKQALQQIGDLEKAIKTKGDSPAAWDELRNAVAQVENTELSIALKGAKYLLWEKDIWGPIAYDENVPRKAAPLQTVRIVAGQNGRSSRGFLVTNLSAGPLMGRILPAVDDREARLTQPQRPKDINELPAANLSFYRGAWVEMQSRTMVPDALIPLPLLDLVEVPPGQTLLVWFETDTTGLAPGKYQRRIFFRPSYAGLPATQFDIDLEVLPVDLTEPDLVWWAFEGIGNMRNQCRFPGVARDLVRHGCTHAFFMPDDAGWEGKGYPKLDKEGNLLSADLSMVDAIVNNMVAAGLPRDRVGLVVYLATAGREENLRCVDGRIPFGDWASRERPAAWERGFKNLIVTLRDRLLKLGVSQDRVIFMVSDEMSDDPARPGAAAFMVMQIAQHIRQIDPKLRVVLNPCQVGNDFIPANYIRYLDEYARVADTFMPLPLNLNPEVVAKYAQLAKEQSKVIWTYHTIDKSASPNEYRGMVWQNIQWGFLPTCAPWYCDSAGCPVNSFDPSVYVVTGTMDLIMGYVDQARKEVVASRREKAWYEGNQDGRAYLCCRDRIEKMKQAGKPTAEYEKRLAAIVAGSRADRPGAMDEAREQLLRLAVEMDKTGRPAAKCLSTWWDDAGATTLANLAALGCNQTIYYREDYSAYLTKYLDTADKLKMKVMISLEHFIQRNNLPGLTGVVNAYKNHPAVTGWMLYDEPDISVLDKCTAAYTIIHTACGREKPVYINFQESDFDKKIPDKFQKAFDILGLDSYPFGVDRPAEFDGAAFWMGKMDLAQGQADALNKPYLPVLQGWGNADNYGTRLPSLPEERLLVYYSLLKGARDVSWFFVYSLLKSPASAGPYKGTGIQWQADVARPVMTELNSYAHAVDNGPVAGAAAGWTTCVMGNIYRDPRTGKYYLLTMNKDASPHSIILAIHLPGNWSSLKEYNGEVVSIEGKKVELSFTKFQVRNFELVPGL